MTQALTVFDRYRADVLFLLVGGNPLPNYVAAQLMAKEDADIHLLATPGTDSVAKRLKTKLCQVMDKAYIHHHTMPEAGGYEIEQALMGILSKANIGSRRVGLNYTGGTKDMAVHVYDRIQDLYGAKKAVFSYLDARSLRMSIYIDAQPTQWPSTARAITPTLQDLWELHGLVPKTGKFEQRKTARLPTLCRAIAEVHSTPAGFRQWREWLSSLWGDNGVPPESEQYPKLRPVIDELERLCGGSPDATTLARLIGFERLSSCRDFFRGKWLEEYALDAILSFREKVGIQDWAIGLKLQPPPPEDPQEAQSPDFDLDVVALSGYQLLLLSCIASEAGDPESDEDDESPEPTMTLPAKKKKGAGNRSEAKKHLFEAYVRARQVGGDEAKAALISCVANPGPLQAEVEQKWDAKDKIKVFGQSDLVALHSPLETWFRTANRQ